MRDGRLQTNPWASMPVDVLFAERARGHDCYPYQPTYSFRARPLVFLMSKWSEKKIYKNCGGTRKGVESQQV